MAVALWRPKWGTGKWCFFQEIEACPLSSLIYFFSLMLADIAFWCRFLQMYTLF